jgi:hypothetical protein
MLIFSMAGNFYWPSWYRGFFSNATESHPNGKQAQGKRRMVHRTVSFSPAFSAVEATLALTCSRIYREETIIVTRALRDDPSKGTMHNRLVETALYWGSSNIYVIDSLLHPSSCGNR